MPYVLSFEVNRRYEIRVDSVSEAIARYDETYLLIGAWLERTGASGEFAVVQRLRAIDAARELGEIFRWKSDGNA